MTTTHGPFTVRSTRERDATYRCHISYGDINVSAQSYGYGVVEQEAWREMAVKLAAVIAENSGMPESSHTTTEVSCES